MHVNAPVNVSRSLQKAVDLLRSSHSGLNSNPHEWGENRLQYEEELIAIYGPSRRGRGYVPIVVPKAF